MCCLWSSVQWWYHCPVWKHCNTPSLWLVFKCAHVITDAGLIIELSLSKPHTPCFQLCSRVLVCRPVRHSVVNLCLSPQFTMIYEGRLCYIECERVRSKVDRTVMSKGATYTYQEQQLLHMYSGSGSLPNDFTLYHSLQIATGR